MLMSGYNQSGCYYISQKLAQRELHLTQTHKNLLWFEENHSELVTVSATSHSYLFIGRDAMMSGTDRTKQAEICQ